MGGKNLRKRQEIQKVQVDSRYEKPIMVDFRPNSQVLTLDSFWKDLDTYMSGVVNRHLEILGD